jgi:hypothetical protein
LELHRVDVSNLSVCLKNMKNLRQLKLTNVSGIFNGNELKKFIPGLEITKRNY